MAFTVILYLYSYNYVIIFRILKKKKNNNNRELFINDLDQNYFIHTIQLFKFKSYIISIIAVEFNDDSKLSYTKMIKLFH